MKSILYISYDGMTDPLGQSQVLPYLCGLSASGYQIHLISAEKPDKYLQQEALIRQICAEHSINWHPIVYHNRPAIIGTIYDLIKIRKLALSLHRKNNFSLVHCRSYMPSFTGVFLKMRFGIPYLFDMRGFWVNEKQDGNVWNLNNPIMKTVFNFMKKKEKLFFRSADEIISLTHKAIPEIRKIVGAKSNQAQINVIPCCVDTHHFDYNTVTSAETEEWKRKLQLPEDAFIICYLGSISTWYLPEDMLLFFKSFLAIKPNAIFLIITLEDTDRLIAYATSIGIDQNKIFVTQSKRKELPSLLNLCQASVFFIKPAYSKIASSPTKLGELLSMGIPVICNSGVGDTEDLVLEAEAGVVCKSLDETEYKRAAQEFLALYPGFQKQHLRENAIRLFGLENGISNYRKVYQRLMNQE